MRILGAFLPLVAVLATGCSKDKDDSKTAAPATQEPAKAVEPEPPTPEPPAAATPEPARLANHAKNCPSAVTGAKTEIAEADGAVLMTVTATAETATAEIRRRAEHLVKVQSTASVTGGHTGTGTAGGVRGVCPAVLADTSLAVEETTGGVEITIKPADAAKLAEVKGAAEHRLAELSNTSKGFHTGKGHGSGTGGGSSKGGGGGKGLDKNDDGAAADKPGAKPAKPALKRNTEASGGW